MPNMIYGLFEPEKIDKYAEISRSHLWGQYMFAPSDTPLLFDSSTLLDEQHCYTFNFQRKPSSAKEQMDLQKERFVDELIVADFSKGDENFNTKFITKYSTKTNKDELLCWLGQLYEDYKTNEKFVVKLFNLFTYYPYEELQPISGIIAGACTHHRSIYVQSAAFSLLGHWANRKALEILEAYEEPTNPWVKKKYDRLKAILTRRCAIYA